MALKKKGKKVKKAAKKTTRKTAKKAPKKRPIKKKIVRKKPALKKRKAAVKRPKSAGRKPAKQEGNLVGLVTHYFPHVQAAVIKLKEPLTIGNTVKIKGHTTDLAQIISSMQIDRVDISSAKKGDEIGLLVSSRVRQGDKVYKI